MKKIIITISTSCLFLVSCNSFRDSAGVNRKVIDEYAVVENPPLVIPPNFNLLPPEQIESKNVEDIDSELAKEILFGLEENEEKKESKSSLLSEIIKEVEAEKVDDNIREIINAEFAGEKSSINDESKFETEAEINKAIEDTKSKDEIKIIKKKKKFFFFNNKEKNKVNKENQTKKKKRFFFF